MIAPPPTIAAALERAADATGLPVQLLRAVAWVESRFNPKVTSKVGARGLMQVMPANLDAYGATDGYDPNQSALVGARMLASLHAQFGGWERALAAYNWGSGNVQKHPDPATWPASVHAYVNNVLKNYDATLIARSSPGLRMAGAALVIGVLYAVFRSGRRDA